jgi:hypothetical protein
MDCARVHSGSYCSTTSLRTQSVQRCRPIALRCRAVSRFIPELVQHDRHHTILTKSARREDRDSIANTGNNVLPSAYSLPVSFETSATVKGLAALVSVIVLHAATAAPGFAAETLPADILRSWLVRPRCVACLQVSTRAAAEGMRVKQRYSI